MEGGEREKERDEGRFKGQIVVIRERMMRKKWGEVQGGRKDVMCMYLHSCMPKV